MILYFKLFFFSFFFCIFFLFFFYFFFVGVTKALWSNETGKESLSKVVRRVRNHLNLSFYNNWIGTYGVISIFCDSILLRTFFFFFFLFFFCRRNEGTLVK